MLSDVVDIDAAEPLAGKDVGREPANAAAALSDKTNVEPVEICQMPQLIIDAACAANQSHRAAGRTLKDVPILTDQSARFWHRLRRRTRFTLFAERLCVRTGEAPHAACPGSGAELASPKSKKSFAETCPPVTSKILVRTALVGTRRPDRYRCTA